MPQLLSLCTVEPMLCSKRSHCHEKPAHYNQRRTPTYCNQRKPTCSNKDPVQWEKNLIHHDLMLLFSLSVVSDSMTPWTAARQASLSFTISRSLLKFMSTESVRPSHHLILCRSLHLLPQKAAIRNSYISNTEGAKGLEFLNLKKFRVGVLQALTQMFEEEVPLHWVL